MITLEQSPPNNVLFAGQKLIYIASSSETAEDNFKYNVVVSYLVALDTIELFNGLFDPNPSGNLVFDLSPIIKDRLRMDTESADGNMLFEMPHSTGVTSSNSHDASEGYTVTINEYYGDPAEVVASGLTVYRQIIAGAFTNKDGFEPSMANYLPTFLPNTTLGFYLGRPMVDDIVTIKASDEDYGVICYSCDGLVTSHLLYQLYNGATLLSSESITAGTTAPDAHDGMNYVACYPANLNGDSGLTVKPNSTTWTHYLLRGYLGTVTFWTTKTLKFVNTPLPCKHTPIQIAYHDIRNGCWEFMRFDGRPTPSVSNDSKTYQKVIGDYTGDSFTFDSWARSKENYHNDIEEQWTLQSGLLDVYETQQVRDIVKSPQVLAYIQGQWLPVLVDTKNYSFQVEKISKATFAEIKITIA
jgi:hypothetical protein